MLPTASHVLEELTEPECRRLLTTAPMGRIAVTQGALPMILPVRFTLRGDEVVISVARIEVDNAIRGAILAFEADHYDPRTGEGWCVTVVGPSRVVGVPGEVPELDALGFAPRTPDHDRCYVAVRITVLRGRSLRLRSRQPSVPTPDTTR